MAITFKPSSGTGYTFEDKYTPVASKNEWGIDVLTRAQWGAQPGLVTFIQALAQGQTYSYNGGTWYLQTWECDNDEVYPTVTMTYMGLMGGIPAPKTDGEEADLQGTFSVTSPSSATMTYSYTGRVGIYRYITSGRPTFPTYTAPDIDVEPVIWKSVVYNADGTRYLGNVPAPLLAALTPVGHNDNALMSCTPIVGSPWFACVDRVTRTLPGN